ncbi:adenosine 5'-monophosphoramidase HINT3-like isoform X3 [Oncorhynchus nerka]|uniref:adenosine 5'-monophosphoramidase HINT3-like isoform X3 n=1 Tax=Oncorhynchus nerka TaxID=8023 RepID=UPI0011306450|nr:histidine triad nucleotide-binding protein 3-like isoform X3 [Oncorhynchus nerka]XP_029532406.1 histidine triad nucleotide-binding protein 3-like isoform X3 [Oncorhynchus nerka]
MENSAGDTVQQRHDDTQSNLSSDMEDTCVFCVIAENQDKDTEIVKQDSELVCFRDINPAAPHHYLVVPKKHIVSCFSLFKEHVKLVERMAEMGRAVLQEKGIANPNDIRFSDLVCPSTGWGSTDLHISLYLTSTSMSSPRQVRSLTTWHTSSHQAQ